MSDSARHRAVAAAYAAHADDVYRLAYAILRDPDDAADATQDVFVRAFERWDRYDPQRPLRPWLHAITSRLALDRLRRRRVRRLAIPAFVRDGSSRHADSYAGRDPAVSVLPHETIEAALAGLQPIPRAAVLLRHRYGYDYAEIGAFLGLTTTNVGAVLSRARAALRVRLADDFAPIHRQEEQA
ncbi:MAG: RNA polymerase sigma factor [Chloroflexota bacterium]|nr:RNA polymerase sigma factor [Chloroflexota bacterium]